jgi:deoxyadenosine/deoxycytidine kinase
MIICIEGCPGVGKSSLVQRCAERLPCLPIYEEVQANPFLLDFYKDPKRYGPHVQYTFLMLQERLYRQAIEQVGKSSATGDTGKAANTVHIGTQTAESPLSTLVLCDFHPLKSKIFSSVVLSEAHRFAFAGVYSHMTIPQPDLMVYLRADVHTILARLRKRDDAYRGDVDYSYLSQVCDAYDRFFNQYSGQYLAIDTTYIDYIERPEEMGTLLQQIPFATL